MLNNFVNLFITLDVMITEEEFALFVLKEMGQSGAFWNNSTNCFVTIQLKSVGLLCFYTFPNFKGMDGETRQVIEQAVNKGATSLFVARLRTPTYTCEQCCDFLRPPPKREFWRNIRRKCRKN